MAPTSESRRCSWWKNWRATGTHFKNHKYFESGGSSSLAGSHSSGLLVKGWICLIGTIAHLTARAVVSVGKRNCTSNTFSSWGTLWDAMAIAPLRLPRLGQGSWSPESWVSPPETRLNIPSSTNDFSRPKVEAIAHFYLVRARANETMDGIFDRVNGLMLLSTSCRAIEDLVSGAIFIALSLRSLLFTHGSVSHILIKPADRPFSSPFFAFSLNKSREMSASRTF